MKKCPYCAEEIQDEAIKCRFCGELLKKKKRWKSCLMGCLIAFAVAIILFILFISVGFLILRLIFNKIFFWTPHLPPYAYPPFTGGGLEGILRDFGETFRAFWERLMDFLRFGSQTNRITF